MTVTHPEPTVKRGFDQGQGTVDVTIVAHDIGSVGGMEHQLAELILGLARLGHRVTVIARTCALTPDDQVTPLKGEIDFHRVPGPSRPVLLAYPWFMLVAGLILRRSRRGIVNATGAIVLNRVDVIAIHYCHQVGPVNPSRSSLIFRAHAWAVGHMLRIGERMAFKLSAKARFVCVSDGVAGDVRLHYPQLADRVMTIPNGVDTETFAPGLRRDAARAFREQALQIPADQLVAVFVGSEWERKGLQPLLRALPAAPGWTLVVAGDGDERRYRGLAESLGVASAVRWLGVSRDVQLVYEMADALVFPSSYEAFSLVTLEAAASGLPILATPINGVRELLVDGHNGFLISQDPEVIAERLMQLSADPELRARMGAAAREAALDFRWETMVLRHHELYAQLAGQARHS